jgi:membrane associated rhomboid family serine protease
MHGERTFLEQLIYQWKHGGMMMKLLFINSFIFIVIQLISVFGRLMGIEAQTTVTEFLISIFGMETTFSSFLLHPWGIFTSIFAHFTLFHFISNMLFLYFAGKLFESIFEGKYLFFTYIFGGIFGGLIELIAHASFPSLQDEAVVIVGGSGSIMTLFATLAFYRPNLTISIFGIFNTRLIFIAAAFILSDLISLGINDGTAHFAHIGGVIFGGLTVVSKASFFKFYDRLTTFTIFQKKSHLKVKKGTRTSTFKTDEEYNLEKRKKQDKTDAILDKIAKSGYESLSKTEKEFLFNQSKNG